MKAQVNIDKVVIDSIKNITHDLKSGKGFKLTAYDPDDGSNDIGIWLETEQSTIMFDVTKQQAFFLGNSLLSISKSKNI